METSRSYRRSREASLPSRASPRGTRSRQAHIPSATMSLVRYSNVILPMHREGKSMAAIHRELQKINSEITYYSVRKFLQESSSRNLPAKEKEYHPRSLAPHISTIKRIVADTYRANNSATVRSILDRLLERGIDISPSQLRNLRKKWGFIRATTKYCHVIRDVNKEKRVSFCERMLDCNEDFHNWIFTDESTVQVDTVVKYCYVKKGDYFSRLRSKAKHPAKLHLWGGISMRGATELAIFPGSIRLDSEKYCRILERCLLRFNNDAYHGYGKLVQDNAPAHTSAYTKEKLRSWKIDVVDWPPESPDLNPIELIWGTMKGHIRRQRVKNLQDLRDAVITFWKSLTPEVCAQYVRGIPRRMEQVIAQGGRNIKE